MVKYKNVSEFENHFKTDKHLIIDKLENVYEFILTMWGYELYINNIFHSTHGPKSAFNEYQKIIRPCKQK